MSITRPVLTLFTIMVISAAPILAQDKPLARAEQKAESLATVNKEYQQALDTWSTEVDAAYAQAKKDGKELGFKLNKASPNARFSPRFLAIAEQNPEGPYAIDALKMTLRTSSSNVPKPGAVLETRAKAIDLLREYYAAKPPIIDFLETAAQSSDPDSKRLLAEVIAKNPDRKVQAAAYKEQLAYCEQVIQLADSSKNLNRREGVERGFIEKRFAMAAKAKIELDALKKVLHEKYTDLYTDVLIGSPSPELDLRTVDGKSAKLSELKGKVVVLDIWATWCGHCIEMNPHEREMVARHKDKPFVLVSISVDAKLETLKSFVAKEKMPWTHWWNGAEGGIIDAWDVRGYPTIYVIDAQGVIRYKQVGSVGEFQKVVDNLLEPMEPKKTAAK